MSKKSSNKNWLKNHQNDFYVKQAQKDGFRSRAVYKLIEITNKNNFIQKNDCVLDLGASPGSWSQYIVKKIKPKGQMIAVDILPMKPIQDVDFILGDFTNEAIYQQITEKLNHKKLNVVVSDMSPNITGFASVDIPKAMYLAELALNIALKSLQQNGHFFTKLFQGSGFDLFVKNCNTLFKKVSIIKPKASRPKSKEMYLLAQFLK